MTAPGRHVWVVGVDGQGREVARTRLPHGGDPELLLLADGWEVLDALPATLGATATLSAPGRGAAGTAADGSASVELSFRVRPGGESTWESGRPPDPVPPPRGPEWDPDLVPDLGEVAVPVQRVAAYGLVSSARGVLLTQYSGRTNAEGLWGLPGGGLDPDETPEAAMRREVAEETGQQLDRVEFLGVRSRHWVGRAPGGRLEDFHGIALLYRAGVLAPTDPVVHDIGGTTAAAAWVAPEAVAALPISPTWMPVLTVWLGW